MNKQTLRNAWLKTVRVAMRRQFLADPIELLDFHTRLSEECQRLEEKLLNGTYEPACPRRVLVEKSKGLCRQIVIPDARDAILMQCLSDAFYDNLKTKSPSKNAFFEPERHSFSQITREKQTYGSFRSWLKFQSKIFNFTREHKYIIVTDISNYYDFVGHQHLRNVITDYVDGAKESILDLLIFILSEMTWQPDYMPRPGVGLPQIDLDSPRLLANCFLYELDEMITRNRGIDYVRFMDDIDIGVDDIPTAKRLLRDIDLTLQSRQVRLNAGKTKILSQSEAIQHFKIAQNGLISEIEDSIERKVLNGDPIQFELVRLQRLLVSWYSQKVFDDGNGDKILKRIMNILTRHKGKIDTGIIRECLSLRPSLREAIYRHMCMTSPNVPVLECLLDYLEGDYVVDEASYIDFATYFVDSRIKTSRLLLKRILRLVEEMVASKQEARLHAAFIILSKIGDEATIGRHLEASYDYWKNDYGLGRVIGSLRPILWETPYRNKFANLIRHSRNLGAQEVFDFLYYVGSDRRIYQSVRRFLFAPNVTYPNRITHAKFLVVWAALQGDLLSDKAKDTLRVVHKAASADPYYELQLYIPTVLNNRRSPPKQTSHFSLPVNRARRRARA